MIISYIKRFANYLKMGVMVSLLATSNVIYSGVLVKGTIAAAAFTGAALALIEANREYEEASDPKKDKKTYQEQAEHLIVKWWNKTQRAVLGRTSVPDIAKQEFTQGWVDFRSWWRRYDQFALRLFVAFCMGILGLIYSKKALNKE